MRERKPFNVEIGYRLQTARMAAGLTQEQFAELLPMAAANVSAIECGAVGISLKALARACQILSVSSDSILFGEPQENDVDRIAARLKRLPPAKYRIASDMINTMFQALSVNEDE